MSLISVTTNELPLDIIFTFFFSTVVCKKCTCCKILHSSCILTGSRFRPVEVTAKIDETAESRESADVASWREIDNIVSPLGRLLKWGKLYGCAIPAGSGSD